MKTATDDPPLDLADDPPEPEPSTPAEQVEEFASLQFSDAEIATIMQLEVEDLRVLYQDAINRGRLLAEAQVRRSMVKLAKMGNPQAQKAFMGLNRRAKASAKKKDGAI